MDKLKMCRICLTEDIRLHFIGHTHLKTIYETLTMMPFETEDCRPIQVCYICCARLQSCYQLKKSCCQSEDLFTQMLTHSVFQLEKWPNKQTLNIVHPVIHLSVEGPLQEPPMYHQIKQEHENIEDVTTEGIEDTGANAFLQPSTSYLGDRFSIEVIKSEIEDQISTPILFEDSTTVRYNTKQMEVTSQSTVHSDPSFSSYSRTLTGKKLYQCNACKLSFKLKHSLSKHMRKHSNKISFECNICKKCFSLKSRLDRHLGTHVDEQPFQCTICQKRFMQKAHLRSHSRIHTGVKPYQCEICKKYFKYKISLNKHMREHATENLYQCHVCKKCFNNKANLTRHIRIHNGDKPYQCEICKKSFSRSAHLFGHMRVHTGEKPFQCNLCKKRFTNESNLNIHVVRSHIGEKRFQCNVCNRCFNHRGNFDVHMLIHSGEKPYRCDICKKCFRHKSTLKQHLITHTD